MWNNSASLLVQFLTNFVICKFLRSLKLPSECLLKHSGQSGGVNNRLHVPRSWLIYRLQLKPEQHALAPILAMTVSKQVQAFERTCVRVRVQASFARATLNQQLQPRAFCGTCCESQTICQVLWRTSINLLEYFKAKSLALCLLLSLIVAFAATKLQNN